MSGKRAKAKRKAAKEPHLAQARAGVGGGLPAYLYKYAPVDLERIHDVLVGKQIWFADPQTLNDPFDCRVVPDLSSPEIRNAWAEKLTALHQEKYSPSPEQAKDYREKIRSNDPATIADAVDMLANDAIKGFGVCCLTEKPDNLPMWAHYASAHEGVCYWFDLKAHPMHTRSESGGPHCFPFTFLRQVKYQGKYRAILPSDEIRENRFLVKSRMWEYESEWRSLAYRRDMWEPFWEQAKTKCPPVHAERIRNHFQGPGGRRLDGGLLHGVILGCRMGRALKNNIASMAREGNVRVFEARLKHFEYGLDIRPYEN